MTMLLIPVHIITDSRSSTLASFFNTSNDDIYKKNYEMLYRKHFASPFLDEEKTGVSQKTIKNLFLGKHKPTKTTIKTIASNLITFWGSIPGISIEGGSIADKYKEYYLDSLSQILRANAFVFNEVQKTAQDSGETTTITEILSKSKLPSEIIKVNFEDKKNIGLDNLFQQINRIRIELVFCLMASHEVEYKHHFYRKESRSKSVMTEILPGFEYDNKKNKTISKPLKNLIYKIVKKHNYITIENFAGDLEKETRTVRKWLSGYPFPSLESIDIISRVLAEKYKKEYLKDEEDYFEFLKEEGRYVFNIVKVFQNILKLIYGNKNLFGMNDNDIVNFFHRYLYWYNYHFKAFEKGA